MNQGQYERFVKKVDEFLDQVPSADIINDQFMNQLYRSYYGNRRVTDNVSKALNTLLIWCSPNQARELFRLARMCHVSLDETITYEEAQRFKRYLHSTLEDYTQDEIPLF